jgi:hypothetical protein
MAIFNLFKKSKPVLFRCTHCYDELELTIKDLRYLEAINPFDPVCRLKDLCPMCHTGFIIPVNYTDKQGNKFLFHQIKPKIKNLNPNTAWKRILDDAEPENIQFFGFLDPDFDPDNHKNP